MLRCLAHSMSRLTAGYYGSDFWSMSMGKGDDGNDQTFEEYVKSRLFPDETEHHPYQKGR